MELKHPLKQVVLFKVFSCLVIAYSSTTVYSVVHIGKSIVKIEIVAGSNDITESAFPPHDNPVTGMFGFCLFSKFIFLCNA